MDFNLVVISGRLAAPPREPDRSGPGRLLLTVRSEEPYPRVDLLPVVVDELAAGWTVGQQLWVAGALQRRFSSARDRSRLEVVARHVEHRR